MPIKALPLLLFSLFVLNLSFGQDFDSVLFKQKEDELLQLYHNIKNTPPNKQAKAESIFENKLFELLKNKNSFYYSFPALKYIGRIQSSDGYLNIFTWNVPVSGGFNNYYCILQFLPKKAKAPFVYKLKEMPSILNKNRQALTGIHNWLGGLYYDIVTTKHNGQVYYTLLGFHFNNMVSNIKAIEVLAFDENQIPYFPQKKFIYTGKSQNRIVFEFNERVQMTLEYNEIMDKIVFDHLAPNRPSLKDQYQFYGPDLSYDALRWDDGFWVHESDIQVQY